jgi:hypothetical protein
MDHSVADIRAVVTTTTTIKFPPLVVPPLRPLGHLDPRLYPLAHRETPPPLQKFTLHVGGGVISFKENGEESMHVFPYFDCADGSCKTWMDFARIMMVIRLH